MGKKTNEENEPKRLPGGVTQAQVEQWKKKHDDIYQIDVEDKASGRTYTGYVHAPDRDTAARTMSLFNADKTLEAGECIASNCWLGGDEEIKTKDKLAIGFAVQSMAAFEMPKTTIKKI